MAFLDQFKWVLALLPAWLLGFVFAWGQRGTGAGNTRRWSPAPATVAVLSIYESAPQDSVYSTSFTMSTQSRILELAATIAKNASAIQDSLSANNLPNPSFAPGGTVLFPPAISSARDTVLDATQELHDLLLYPMELIPRKAAHNQMAHMKAITKYDMANAFDIDEKISFEDLSGRCGLPVQPLRHILRHGMCFRMFSEPQKGMISHTALSALLRDEAVADWVKNGSEELWPSSVYLVDALVQHPNDPFPHHAGFNIAHRTPLSLYEACAQSPALAARFASGMRVIETSPAFALTHLHDAFDWANLGPSARVVDIGGSTGELGISLAQKFEGLKIEVQDLEATVKEANVPVELRDRVVVKAHDFFQPQLQPDGEDSVVDVFLLRWILHNWSDAEATRILRGLIPALHSRSRVVIFDGILPEPGTVPAWREMDARGMDLTMNAYFGAWERDEDEWRALVKQADEKFDVKVVKAVEGSALGLVEVGWRAE